MFIEKFIRDGIEYYDEENVLMAGFNRRTFYLLLQAILVRYLKLSPAEAKNKVDSSYLFESEINCDMDIGYYSHEIPWHWAMICQYGEMYWIGHPERLSPPSDYDAWEADWLSSPDRPDEIFYYR